MQANIGTTDQIIRIAVGIVLILMAFVGPQTLWGWLGLVPIAIAVSGFCPLYKILGISTCKQCETGNP